MSARPSLSAFWALHRLARSSHLLPAHPHLLWRWRGVLKEGSPVSPLVSFSFFPAHDLSFPSPVGPGQGGSPRCPPSRRPLGWCLAASASCQLGRERSRAAKLHFYLTQVLWCEKWTFALHICDAVLLNCSLSKVHISQCGTFLTNEKTLNKYTWIKAGMLIIQTIHQVVCLTSVFESWLHKERINNCWRFQTPFFIRYVKINILENTCTKK